MGLTPFKGVRDALLWQLEGCQLRALQLAAFGGCPQLRTAALAQVTPFQGSYISNDWCPPSQPGLGQL